MDLCGWVAALQHTYSRRLDVLTRGFGGESDRSSIIV